ncbi:ABC transporter permease [Chitinophaga filiformis]|uniref:Putative ABC transport system permease protein n=1 Tax=Chitinophaga filiformis TaxID=104663 RepID=A0A1G7YCU8_CHIFI|nr:ABC transporter permease [Chitinophaga filiformis]SDG94331.1 putative ABC transport system permease protein [Chitinophaga filiformis]
MFSNYCRIAWRNLRRHSFYTILNVFGLSLGIACCLILFQFITYHLDFDGYHQKRDYLYRVVSDLHLDDGSVQYEKGASLALAAAIRAEIPQVKNQAFLFCNYRDQSLTVTVPGQGGARQLFAEHGNVAFADPHWFELFDYEWKAGDAGTLEEPNTAVLTSKQAEKYFGQADPVGKTIRLDDKVDVKITGVLKDYPASTDTKVDVFVSRATMKVFYADMYPAIETEWGWINSSNSLYLLLPENISAAAVNRAIAAAKQRHMGEMAKYYDFHLQPLKEMHFDARYGGTISRSLLMTLGIVGFVILIIACVNFINLATAQNAVRAKEISTRKVLGSSVMGIFWQFMTETAFITLSAALLSVLWVALALPLLNPWLGTGLEFHPLQDIPLAAALLLLIILITLIAGMYPALVLGRFQPVALLKNTSGGAKHPWLRKGLIVFQNLVAQSLIICTLIITLQLNFLKNTDIGFVKDGVVMVPVPKQGKRDLSYLKNQLLQVPGVKDASFCYRPPASASFRAGSVKFDNRDWEDYTALCTLGDAHYLNTFGLHLLAGRNLVESDSVREFLVSEDMVRKLGFSDPAQVIGHQMVAGTLDDHPGAIVGVVKDFNLHSLHSHVEPVLMATRSRDYAFVGIKIGGAGAMKSIGKIRQLWESVYPDNIFEYDFLDDQIAEFYKKEDLLNKLTTSAAVLAIVISCVGLLGLISLLTVQRTKEIGIRKVIGASVMNIILLFSNDFLKLIGLALLLATAVAWIVMNNWLEAFAYRIAIPWWIFLLAGAGNVVLALATIAYHALKVAMMNPVKSLKAE